MLNQIIAFFLSAFRFPGLSWTLILLAIALGLAFGSAWLAVYWPPLRKRPWLWVVGIGSALLTWTVIAFVQIPLQSWTGQVLLHFWNQITLKQWLLLAGIPQILLSGLVQEGSKLVPVVFYWWRNHRSLDPRTGLLAGAIAGAGFGIFEAVWVHNTIFPAGWTWQTVEANGLVALLGFGERFFSIGFHIGVSALAGYGLATGRGWQFYLVASLLHGATNYSVVLLQKGVLTALQVEIYIAALAIAITATALWLRWHKPNRDSEIHQ
ncbi:MAG: PrsW family glutamic-type intramembrane protease [Chloroflexota bacterium]|nr:PrsW family glutamic-type intramembrane protease [Chloroflexota bacterium]